MESAGRGTPAIIPPSTPTATPRLVLAQTPIPATTAVATTPSTQDIQTYRLAEEAVARRINQLRANRGLTVLISNPLLAVVARAHSEDMFTRNFFAHVNPDGLEPQGRVEHAGLTDFACAENLYMVTDATQNDVEEIAAEAFMGWLSSPGHYENMIKPSHATGGVGVFVRSNIIFLDRVPKRYDIYVTHLLCRDISDYTRLRTYYEAAKALLDQLEAECERLKAEYKTIEEQYVNNVVARSQLEEAYEELETTRLHFNAQVDIVNNLVERMNAAAGN